MANFEAKTTVKQGKNAKRKWYPFHACTGGGGDSGSADFILMGAGIFLKFRQLHVERMLNERKSARFKTQHNERRAYEDQFLWSGLRYDGRRTLVI